MKLSSLMAAAAVSLPALAMAQTVPTPNFNIGDAVREGQKPIPLPQAPTENPALPQPEDDPLTLDDGQTIFVRDFRLDGVDDATAAKVLPLLESSRNRDLTMSDIYAAANTVTAYFRQNGMMMAKAHVLKQDASSGILTIKVVQGRLGKVSIDKQSVTHDFLLEGIIADNLQANAPLTRDGVEGAITRIDALPGEKQPVINVTPGQEPGTTDLVVSTKPENRITGYAMADNEGSKYTGTNRLRFGLTVNSPFGLGDQITLSGQRTEALGLQDYKANYAFPLLPSGRLRANVGLLRTTYELGDIYRDLDATGTSHGWEAGLSYDLVNTFEDTIQIAMRTESRQLKDSILGTTLNSRQQQKATLSAPMTTRNSWFFGYSTALTLTPSLSGSYVDYHDSAEAEANRAGANSLGTTVWSGVDGSASVFLSDTWSLRGNVKAQRVLKDKNLDSSDQLSISGPDGVWSFAQGVTGDNGYLLSLEARYNLPTFDSFLHSVGVFTDLGRVYVQNDDYTGIGSGTRLSDIGLGYYSSFEYDNDRYLMANLRLAHTLGPQPATGVRNARAKVLGEIGLTF